MNLIESIILGIVQAITEFLPISSSAHLMIANQLLGISHNNIFATILHGGTFFALIFYFFRELIELLSNRQLFLKIIISTLPPLGLGIILSVFNIGEVGNIYTIPFSLILVGIFFVFWNKIETKQPKTIDTLTYLDSFKIGLYECFAFVSGVSRSGITSIGGYLSGLSFKESIKYSFLIGIPITGFAFLHGLISLTISTNSLDIPILVGGFFSSLIIGYLVIKYMMKSLDIETIKYFGFYRIILAIIIFIMF